MKKLVLFISIFFAIIVTNVLSDELVLTNSDCGDKKHDHLSFSDGYIIYLCDTKVNNVKLNTIVNYFYLDSCPVGYNQLPDLDLMIGDETLSACTPMSMDVINENISHYNRVHIYKGACPAGEIGLFAGENSFSGCLLE
tara:strand:+ start:105 stop:521 length:417 start_codon:yes stop_codon:yes gene_type:complete